MTQERALKTRASLLAVAATEFAVHSYAAASISKILDDSACTKGAMYFHFTSKQQLAGAVCDVAAEVYSAIAVRWCPATGMDPLDAITGLVDDAAQAFVAEVAVRAETRLGFEPEFRDRNPLRAWEAAALDLAKRAVESSLLREGFTAEKFVRVLSVSLVGNRLLALSSGLPATIRRDYTESLDMVLAAAGKP
ncbi:TetR/AcrR family transcriptional regulator [Rhodococcus sp. H29-C3]|uniref:TetR/AcrR family transcriptional regulator n=1 Tax=Rhodococcus sp. H29-C3 TaxID=3046307 RepID=UPI0024BAAF1F|nr:TetR/AcrR family transcriptional regulator [Rhodococcus sp. H29-C3]MDJ0363361.1 TetR family transcriptional regulator [Rhodococcus sp. H29-C3]